MIIIIINDDGGAIIITIQDTRQTVRQTDR